MGWAIMEYKYYKFLRIENSIFENKDNFIIPTGQSYNDYYIYTKYDNLLIVRLALTLDYFTIIDNEINGVNVFEKLRTGSWQKNEKGYIYEDDGFTNKLHRLIFSFVNEISAGEEIHHLGHTFDNRLNSLRKLPTKDVHIKIHTCYENSMYLKIAERNDSIQICDVKELDDLLSKMTSGDYTGYIDKINNIYFKNELLVSTFPEYNTMLEIKKYL